MHVPKTAGTSISNVLKEKDCVELATHGKLESQRDLGNRFVFAFVRNPFEWFGSLYYSHIRQHRKLPIEEFIKTHESWDYFFDTQTSWIKYNGLLDRINFIGKYENLNKDFENFIIGDKERLFVFKGGKLVRILRHQTWVSAQVIEENIFLVFDRFQG